MPPKTTAILVIVIVLILAFVAINEAYGQDNGTVCLSYMVGSRTYHVNNVTTAHTLINAENWRVDLVEFAHSDLPVLIVVTDSGFSMWEITPNGLAWLDL